MNAYDDDLNEGGEDNPPEDIASDLEDDATEDDSSYNDTGYEI